MNPDEMEAEDNEKFDIDFSDVKDRKGFRLPKGEHPARVANVVKTISQNTGSSQFEWSYELTDLPGRTIKRWTTLAPTGKWMLKADLEALGVVKEGSETVAFSRRDVIGRHVILDIVDDSFNGKDTSKVARVKGHPDGPVQKSDEPKF